MCFCVCFPSLFAVSAAPVPVTGGLVEPWSSPGRVHQVPIHGNKALSCPDLSCFLSALLLSSSSLPPSFCSTVLHSFRRREKTRRPWRQSDACRTSMIHSASVEEGVDSVPSDRILASTSLTLRRPCGVQT